MKVKFVSKISNMGPNKLIINIPKDFFEEVQKLKTKQIRVVIDDEF